MEGELNIKRQILMVDANSMTIARAKVILSEDFLVFSAGTIDDAIELMKTHQFSVVILDIHTPGSTTSLEFVEDFIKVKHKCSFIGVDTALIIVSENADAHELEEFLEAGANHYILKPFSPLALLKSVETHMKISDKSTKIREKMIVAKDIINDFEKASPMRQMRIAEQYLMQILGEGSLNPEQTEVIKTVKAFCVKTGKDSYRSKVKIDKFKLMTTCGAIAIAIMMGFGWNFINQTNTTMATLIQNQKTITQVVQKQGMGTNVEFLELPEKTQEAE